RYRTGGSDLPARLPVHGPAGGIHAVPGRNRAGKSTLLAVLRGLLRPRRGRVDTAGTPDGKVVLLGSDPRALFVRETVRAEIADASPLPEGPDRAERRSALTEAFGIAHLMDRHPMDLSSGEGQKLALVLALLRDPGVLLLDEPTRGLDPAARETLGALLRGLADEGKGILLVTHDVEFAASASDTCSLLFDGEIVSDGAPPAFFAGNRFYTTAANRMARTWFPDVVTVEDILARWRLVP
ncbi:MAG: ATP-binding cassette domain-containing protein, partial [Clostridia bacterium]|nr:ATP-binding cassette domain-containing protein [Clostridia bacterium]